MYLKKLRFGAAFFVGLRYVGLPKKTKTASHLRCCFCVIRTGFEPMTVCLEGRCSIQLSYRTDLVYDAKLRRIFGLTIHPRR